MNTKKYQTVTKKFGWSIYKKKKPRNVIRKIFQIILINNISIISLLIIIADNIYTEIKILADFEKNITEKKFKKTVENWEKTEVKTENSNKKKSVYLFRQYL